MSSRPLNLLVLRSPHGGMLPFGTLRFWLGWFSCTRIRGQSIALTVFAFLINGRVHKRGKADADTIPCFLVSWSLRAERVSWQASPDELCPGCRLGGPDYSQIFRRDSLLDCSRVWVPL